MRPTPRDEKQKEKYGAAVAWQATEEVEKKAEGCYAQRAQGMFTTLVQARALYDFYEQKERRKPGDAWASDFAPRWTWESVLYRNYMANWKPVNKRVFHFVYDRSKAIGANDPINAQVELRDC
jgi:hypothetical protein